MNCYTKKYKTNEIINFIASFSTYITCSNIYNHIKEQNKVSIIQEEILKESSYF
jgi:hypothetical protein